MATRCPHALIHLARVGSTNDYAKERYRLGAGRDVQADDLAGPLLAAARSAAAGGLPLPVDVVVADEQTAGRGRLDRTWQSRSGETLVVSLVAAVPARMLVELGGGWLTSACGLACLDGLRVVLRQSGLDSTVEPPDIESPGPSLALRLKWPNDLCLLQDDPARPLVKVGGILCEMRSRSTGSRLVIGCGLNLFGLPGGLDADQPVGAVFGHGLTGAGAGSDDALLARVMLGVGQALLAGVEQLVTGGFEPFMSRWQQLDVLAGRPVRVHRADGSRDAVALGIDAAGGLQVRYEDGAGAESLATLTAEQVSIRPRG